MKVVLVVSNLEFGGAQRQVLELARCLEPGRFEAHVCSLSPYVPLAEQLPRRVERCHVVAKRGKFDLSVVPRLASLLRKLGADVVHGFLFDAQVAARLAGRLAATPLIVDSERNSDYRVKPVQRLAFRLTRGCVDLVIANSRAGAAFHRRLHGHRESQYRVVYNGVDGERFRPLPRDEVRRELGISPGEHVVGMFGSYKPQKNHPMFFQAARLVLDRDPAARFLVVGDELLGGHLGSDEHKRRVASLVNRLGLRERCLFLGNRKDPERLYNACDVVVLPSLYEGTPNVLLEAMACGVPVVASDVADNRHLVPDGRVGFVVPVGDASLMAERVGTLLANASERQRFGDEARRWVTDAFSLRRLAAETGDIYEAAWRAKRADLTARAGSAVATERTRVSGPRA